MNRPHAAIAVPTDEAHDVPTRRLDCYDVGAEIRHDLRRVGAHDYHTQIDDSDAMEGASPGRR